MAVESASRVLTVSHGNSPVLLSRGRFEFGFRRGDQRGCRFIPLSLLSDGAGKFDRAPAAILNVRRSSVTAAAVARQGQFMAPGLLASGEDRIGLVRHGPAGASRARATAEESGRGMSAPILLSPIVKAPWNILDIVILTGRAPIPHLEAGARRPSRRCEFGRCGGRAWQQTARTRRSLLTVRTRADPNGEDHAMGAGSVHHREMAKVCILWSVRADRARQRDAHARGHHGLRDRICRHQALRRSGAQGKPSWTRQRCRTPSA